MKQINSNVLLENLMADTRQIILDAGKVENLSSAFLQILPKPGIWSIAQIFSHLNYYSRYYIPAVEEKLHQNQQGPVETFHPGWFGNYFTKKMKPAEDGTVKNKMKTTGKAIPWPQANGKEELAQFIADQHKLLRLLEIAKTANLNTVRIPTSLTKYISLKLGDTFRFFIAHEQRHMIQLDNTVKMIGL